MILGDFSSFIARVLFHLMFGFGLVCACAFKFVQLALSYVDFET